MNVLVFHSKAKNQIWMTGSKLWQDYTKAEAIAEYRRFTTSDNSARIKQEINDLAQASDLAVSFVRCSDDSRGVKRDLRNTFRAMGVQVVGNV